MNLEQLRAKLAGIVAQLDGFKSATEFSDEDVTSINALSEEFEATKKQIEAAEKIQAMTSDAQASVRKVKPVVNVEVGQDRRILDPKAGFQNSGEFFRSVVKAATTGNVDNRLSILNAGAKESIGEDGGFLIPSDIRSAIQEKVMGDESLLSLTQQFVTASNNLTLPTDEVAPWSSEGIQAYWEGEAAAFRESKPKFGELQMRLHKLTSLVRVTEELLEDAPALESYLRMKAPSAMLHKVNNAIISGTGAGMPLGILNSGFKYKVAAEGGQAADTVLFANVNKMLSRILPASFGRAVWLVHPAVLEQLRAMQFVPGAASPVPVYMPASGVAGAPFGTLFGRPIMPMMGGVKELGTEGDIMLVDLSYYYSVVKTTGVKQDISTHVWFDTQEVAFRFSQRIAGQVPYKSNVTTQNGAFEMSGFVTLADR